MPRSRDNRKLRLKRARRERARLTGRSFGEIAGAYVLRRMLEYYGIREATRA